MLAPLLATAEGRFEDAIYEWEKIRSQTDKTNFEVIVQQNLAVNFLYAGRLKDARELMENAVQQGKSYRSLIFNLATIYELSSERSRDLKMNLTDKVASQDGTTLNNLCRANTDFKL